jgi:hypothetical protein
MLIGGWSISASNGLTLATIEVLFRGTIYERPKSTTNQKRLSEAVAASGTRTVELK